MTNADCGMRNADCGMRNAEIDRCTQEEGQSLLADSRGQCLFCYCAFRVDERTTETTGNGVRREG